MNPSAVRFSIEMTWEYYCPFSHSRLTMVLLNGLTDPTIDRRNEIAISGGMFYSSKVWKSNVP